MPLKHDAVNRLQLMNLQYSLVIKICLRTVRYLVEEVSVDAQGIQNKTARGHDKELTTSIVLKPSQVMCPRKAISALDTIKQQYYTIPLKAM